jgi:hypothetical protein
LISQMCFDELAAAVPANAGIAIVEPAQTRVYSWGEWSAGAAWSTIKVPLAVAALRHDRRRAEPLVVKAITESDNPASEELWSLLGAPAQAARLVQAVIVEAGDTSTIVESRRLRTGFTAFGQTHWPLVQQARFAAGLSGIPDAAPVVDLMQRLVPEHLWGLAGEGVAAKGGWGPSLSGDYLVRQFGIVPAKTGHLGVALAAQAKTFGDGKAVLDRLAELALSHLR